MFCYLQYFRALCKTVPYCSDIIGIVDLELGVFVPYSSSSATDFDIQCTLFTNLTAVD